MHKITVDLAEPQKEDIYFIYLFSDSKEYCEYLYLDTSKRVSMSVSTWKDSFGDCVEWEKIKSIYNDSYIESLAERDERMRAEAVKQVTFVPELLTEKLSVDGEYVMVESEDNTGFSCSNCGGYAKKEFFEDSMPDFYYCRWCGGMVKEHQARTKNIKRDDYIIQKMKREEQ